MFLDPGHYFFRLKGFGNVVCTQLEPLEFIPDIH